MSLVVVVDRRIIGCTDSWPQDGDSEGAVVGHRWLTMDPRQRFGPSRLSASSNVVFAFVRLPVCFSLISLFGFSVLPLSGCYLQLRRRHLHRHLCRLARTGLVRPFVPPTHPTRIPTTPSRGGRKGGRGEGDLRHEDVPGGGRRIGQEPMLPTMLDLQRKSSTGVPVSWKGMEAGKE